MENLERIIRKTLKGDANMRNMLESFYKDKKVFITGNSGFKGSWLSCLLIELGADVVGYALEPETNQSMFSLLSLRDNIKYYLGDIRDLDYLTYTMGIEKPDIAIHMAAQTIVRTSYTDPVYTYQTNIMGTVNFMEAVRNTNSVKSVINVTTDKVYENKGLHRGYNEDDNLKGYDPYSNSKSCSELITAGYIKSFFEERQLPVSTCRSGNVIGGGDYAQFRIIPDCVRATMSKEEILIRNPDSIRPYQHVMEPISAYLRIAMEQERDFTLAGCYNIGPDESGSVKTLDLVKRFCHNWGEDAKWKVGNYNGPHEAELLKLNCTKVKKIFGIKPVWNIETAIKKTVEWYKIQNQKNDIWKITNEQICEYLDEMSSTTYYNI